ncbi:MAG TPA: preprotein translocase subunit YajC [Planctomycetes bacterium]|nr:preprotein translocase subunit YajC [Planctomycetota bacterium]
MLGLLVIAGEAPVGTAGGGSMLTFFLPLIVVFFIMYWLMIRPQKKAEEKRREMISALGKGDKVVTVGGIVGQVVEIDEKTVTLKIDQSKNVDVKFLKEAVRGVERKKDGGEQQQEEKSS